MVFSPHLVSCPGTAKLPLTSHGKSPARRRYHAVVPLGEVSEMPKRPDEVFRCREVAKGRKEELKDIFTSRHSESCDALRAQLADLDLEVDGLKDRVSTLQRDLQDATDERMAKEKEEDDKWVPVRTTLDGDDNGDGEDEDEDKVCNRCGLRSEGDGEEDEEPNTNRGSVFKRETTMDDETVDEFDIKGEDRGDERRGGTIKRKKTSFAQTGLGATQRRLQAEQRFVEATLVHNSTVEHLRGEIQVLKMRMQRQLLWTKHLDEEMLKTEIVKTRYRVRLEHAERRVTRLGKDLNKAYEDVTRLVKKRLEVEGVSVHNDALAAYLNFMRKEDVKNATEFIDNKPALRAVRTICHAAKMQTQKYNQIVDEITVKKQLCSEIIDISETVACLTGQLHQLWVAIPAALKEFVFSQKPRDGEDQPQMHPQPAIQRIQASSSRIVAILQKFTDILDQAILRHAELTTHDGETGELPVGAMYVAIDHLLGVSDRKKDGVSPSPNASPSPSPIPRGKFGDH